MEKKYWTLDGDKIVIKNKKYSIYYVTILSYAIKIISIALLAYSTATFLYLQKTNSVIGMLLAATTFIFGYIFGKIAKNANNEYLDERSKDVLQKHQDRIMRIRSGEES